MSRDLFEPWASGATDDTLAAALAALGVAAGLDPGLVSGDPSGSEPVVGEAIGGAEGRPVAWRDPRRAWPPSADPAAWAAVWERTGAGALRFALSLDPGLDPAWIGGLLRSPAVGAHGVFVDNPRDDETPVAPWRYPIRIGVLPGPAGAALLTDVRRAMDMVGWMSHLTRPTVVGKQGVACELLLLEGHLDQVDQDLAAIRELRAGAAVVLGPPGDVTEARHLIGTAPVVGITQPSDRAGWLIELIRQLSHDAPFDVAFHLTSWEGGVLWADPDVLEARRVTRRAVSVAAGLRTLDGGAVRGDGPGSAALAADLEDLATGAFASEEGEASTLVEMERAAAPIIEEAAGRRALQARIGPAEADDVWTNRFERATEHVIEVRIAPPDGDWLVAAETFPEDRLPTEGPHRLTVVLTEPHLLASPQVGVIVLPDAGASTTVRFSLTTGADTESVDARITVLHRNRVLQTARLPAEVEVPAEGRRGGLRREAEAVASPETVVTSTAGLEDRRTFDAAIVVNHGEDGSARATAVAGEEAGIVSLDDTSLAAAVDRITARLGEIVEAPEDFGALEADGSVELLIFLAHQGRILRGALVGDFLSDALAEAEYLQVVSARPDAFFPFEFAYDFAAPDEDADLCPDATAALLDPEAVACPGTHDAAVICPFGFWAVSKVIERHTFQRGTDLPGAFLIRSSPSRDRGTIDLSPSLVVAASARVDAVAPGSIDEVVTGLGGVGTVTLAETWQAWEAAMAGGSAGVALALPHTVFSDTFGSFGLEIGSDDRAWAGDIDDRFVPPIERPLALALLGCETAAAGEVGYERFPALFRRAGAEVVFGTLTEVLGRHAAPVGRRLVEALYEATDEGPIGVGDVLVRLRRRLLAEGLMMILAVAAFGDADWVVAREE